MDEGEQKSFHTLEKRRMYLLSMMVKYCNKKTRVEPRFIAILDLNFVVITLSRRHGKRIIDFLSE